MFEASSHDDGYCTSFHTYADMYKRLAYNHFPLKYLFFEDESGDSSISELKNREDCRKLALWRASKKFQKLFDLNRSYHENKGNLQKMEDDILKIFWYLYRQEFPNAFSIKSEPYKYKNSCRSNIENIRREYRQKKKEEERLNRLRGATKRYEKEVDYRNKIGDKEFNRRMKEEKVEKHKKGSNNNEKYLAFILWRKEQLKTPNSIYFNCSVESSNVINKLYNFGYRCTKEKGTYILKNEFSGCLQYFLKKEDCNIWIEINEGGFGNTSMKHAWLNNGFFTMDGATREKTVCGFVSYYAIHPIKGLLISLDQNFTKMKILYPEEYRMFQEYNDPETGEYLGVPSHIHSMCHVLRTVNGNIRFKIITNNWHFMVSNYMTPGCETKTKKELIYLVENDGIDAIEERLKKSINYKHESNKKNGIKIQEIVNKKVNYKMNGNNLDQLAMIVSMFEKGLLTTEEFSASKKKILNM